MKSSKSSNLINWNENVSPFTWWMTKNHLSVFKIVVECCFHVIIAVIQSYRLALDILKCQAMACAVCLFLLTPILHTLHTQARWCYCVVDGEMADISNPSTNQHSVTPNTEHHCTSARSWVSSYTWTASVLKQHMIKSRIIVILRFPLKLPQSSVSPRQRRGG